MSSQRTSWFKSSYSGPNGECVEARRRVAGIEIRDSKDLRGPVVEVSSSVWMSFLAGLKS